VDNRVVVVGCGAWGRNHVRVLSELGALCGVADSNAAQAADAARDVDVPALSVPEVIGDQRVTGVVVATPPSTHADLALAFLLAGKDVLVEKPLALGTADANRLCEIADHGGRILMVGHLMRYHPAFVALQRLVASGALGRLQYIYSTRLNLGRFRREESILWSFAPHDISMILALVGAVPDVVTATGAAFLHKTIADVTTTHMSFPAGEHAHVFVSWLHPQKEQRLVVIGDKAMAVLDDTRSWAEKLEVFDHRIDWASGIPEPIRAQGRAVMLDRAEPLTVECKHFLNCIATRERPVTDGHEGAAVLAVLDRAQRALDAGRSPEVRQGSAFVHPSAFVDEEVVIGSGTSVWHFCHIMPGARIGRDCSLGQNVHVGRNVLVGDRVRVQNNVSLFEGVILEDDVLCGPSCVFTNVLTPRAEVDRGSEFIPTVVRRGASIGANATVLCGNEIGEYSLVGAGAVVTRDVKPHALVVGVPAVQVGWVSHAGEVLGEDGRCPRTGRQYDVRDGRLLEVT
jgi:UDP-2-acetamido-3-amino-2,3-dideoxy-glucuronate N-acetyltransferase